MASYCHSPDTIIGRTHIEPKRHIASRADLESGSSMFAFRSLNDRSVQGNIALEVLEESHWVSGTTPAVIIESISSAAMIMPLPDGEGYPGIWQGNAGCVRAQGFNGVRNTVRKSYPVQYWVDLGHRRATEPYRPRTREVWQAGREITSLVTCTMRIHGHYHLGYPTEDRRSKVHLQIDIEYCPSSTGQGGQAARRTP